MFFLLTSHAWQFKSPRFAPVSASGFHRPPRAAPSGAL